MNDRPQNHPRTHPSVRDVLLDATEQLLGIYGVARTSVRRIVNAAGANLGAINYHFGSKENLIAEVILRRMRPVDRERIGRLDALESVASEGAPTLESVLGAFVRPMVEADNAQGQQTIVFRLLDRAFHEADPGVRQLMHDAFREVASRFDAAILRALPGLPPSERFWGIMFAVGAIHHGLEVWSHLDSFPPIPDDAPPSPVDRETFIERAIKFIAAGLRAQCPAAAEKELQK
jgi:AcrR family transcriptional regulator